MERTNRRAGCSDTIKRMVYIKKNTPHKERAGFTLIETLIVVAIVIIMAAVAVPSFKNMLVSERLQSVAFQMVQDLRQAREDAILYQQDLNIYFNYDNTPVDYLSGINFNNRQYCFETYQEDPLSIPPEHYIPTDSPNQYFKKRVLKYHIIISNITSTTASSVNFGAKNYFVISFRSGAGDTFRGEADIVTNMETDAAGEKRIVSLSDYAGIGTTPVIIELEDVPTGRKFYVRISATGKISMYGQPTPY